MFQRQLRRPVQNVADLFPVLQVAAVIHGHTGEIVETRVDQVIVSIHSHDGRIGMETGQDGVPQFNFDGSSRSGFLRTAGSHSCKKQENGQREKQDFFQPGLRLAHPVRYLSGEHHRQLHEAGIVGAVIPRALIDEFFDTFLFYSVDILTGIFQHIGQH